MNLERLYYVLDQHGQPRHESSLYRWAMWMEDSARDGTRRVAQELVDGLTVSTVFLSLDHSFGAGGPPILWETMVFAADGHSSHDDDDPRVGRQDRCAGTREQAEAQHARVVEWVKAWSKQPGPPL